MKTQNVQKALKWIIRKERYRFHHSIVKAIGCPHTSLYRWESGQTLPSKKYVQRLVDIYPYVSKLLK